MTRDCNQCGKTLTKKSYSSNQWRKGAGLARCQECVAKQSNDDSEKQSEPIEATATKKVTFQDSIPSDASSASSSSSESSSTSSSSSTPTSFFDSGPTPVTCQCGAVKYKVSGSVLDVVFCHCIDCRRFFSQPFSYGAICSKGSVQVEKESETCMVNVTDSTESKSFAWVRCKKCNSFIYGKSVSDPENAPFEGILPTNLIAAETTDFPTIFKPKRHIFYDHRVVDINDNLPKYSMYPVDYSKTPPTLISPLSTEDLEKTARLVRY